MSRQVPAVARALDILEQFVEHESLTMPEITALVGLPRTTVHELVSTLAARGYLTVNRENGHLIRLGMRPFQLGSLYAERLDLATEGQAVAQAVGAECGETIHLATLDCTDVVYIAKLDSTHTVRMVSAVGRTLPAHCTAVGKMLIASLPTEDFDARYPPEQPLPAMTPNSITSVQVLRNQVNEARELGIAMEYCESNPDVACVAAPVRNHTGDVIAAMSISVPVMRWNPERQHELEQLIKQGADDLSARLGYVAQPLRS